LSSPPIWAASGDRDFSDFTIRSTPRKSASRAQSSSMSDVGRMRRAEMGLSLEVATCGWLSAKSPPHLPQRKSPSGLVDPSPGTSCWQVEHHMH